MNSPTKIFIVLLLATLAANTARARFLQTDPVAYDDQINLYAYVHNDPVNKVDPDGKEAACITLNSGCWGDRSDPDTAVREARAGNAIAFVALGAASALGPEALILGRVGAVAGNLMRGAEIAKPLASGASAAAQRFGAVVSNLRALGAGQNVRTIASGAVRAGEKGYFRGAETAAKNYGGNAADYTKVSVSRVTDSGDRVSIHAIRNEVTGKIYEQKVIYGR